MGAEKVALISHQLWQRDFGSSPDIVGKGIRINGKPATMEQLEQLAGEIGKVSKDVTVLVRSDETAELRYALQAMDVCRKHGLNKIRLQTR